ncbi:MAG: NAD(P)H-hydrate dehydratase [Saprospiraceae bacterium]|nr:NAD(P)H-hydrate dehydratase [Saprospiraceae bacterium]
MKVLSIEQIREADKYTIENEPIESINLMERAGENCFNCLCEKIEIKVSVKVFVGLGNNGGDGLVIARLLSEKGYNVQVFVIRYSHKSSNDFQINYERLSKIKEVEIIELNPEDSFPFIKENDVIIDAIFGSGLTKPISGFIGDIIQYINNSNAFIISIDIPSGLFADKPISEKDGAIIHADFTLSLQFPKLAMLFPENDRFVGDWYVIPIGLHTEFIAQTKTQNYLVEECDIVPLLKVRDKFEHKGNFGHALLISGSYGKIGASVLASKACLRTGVGLLTTHIPKSGYKIIQTATPETMVSIDEDKNCFTGIENISEFNAIGIGPGLGMDEKSQKAMKLLIQNTACPMVFDADAINILGENKTWLAFLPKGSILTPHPKEFERIAFKTDNSYERLILQKGISMKFGIYIVLKGAHTSITCPDGSCYFNSTGNPGMATAGSGDVLTGIILGLLAQGYSAKIAAILGVYLHGRAGDIASEIYGEEALIAGDIVECLGEGFMSLKSQV